MTDFMQITTAIGSEDGARQIADTLVSRHLAACVHIVGPITSVYWWQGKMETAQEWVCVAKTRHSLYDAVEAAIREIHPYDEPEILATPILTGSRSYLEWIAAETMG